MSAEFVIGYKLLVEQEFIHPDYDSEIRLNIVNKLISEGDILIVRMLFKLHCCVIDLEIQYFKDDLIFKNYLFSIEIDSLWILMVEFESEIANGADIDSAIDRYFSEYIKLIPDHFKYKQFIQTVNLN